MREFAARPALMAWISFCNDAIVYHRAMASKLFEEHDHSMASYHTSVWNWYQQQAGEAFCRVAMLDAMGED